MGYLSDVEAGGATAFCEPNHEEILRPNRGSVAFWWSLDTKGHRLQVMSCKQKRNSSL